MPDKFELLAPAGSMKHLKYAFAYGADAVYAGMPRYSLRVRNNEFSTLEAINKAIDYTRQQQKKLFLACNVLPHNAKIKTFLQDLQPVVDLGPDAFIMADPGLIMMVREKWPEVDIHLSVQANTMNYASVKFWQQIGIKRIILSRELSLDQVEEIRQQCPDIELEVFVHGALCIAYSGRCLLSGYFNHRDANQGVCTNACRWEYKVLEDGKSTEQAVGQSVEVPLESVVNGNFVIEEQKRPGEYMPIEQDEHGTYIMNSKDLRAVEHISRLIKIGIDSFKIEGRTKSHYYVARSTQAYHAAILDELSGNPFNPELISDLDNLANRGYTDGFYQRHSSQTHQNYLDSYSRSSKQLFVGDLGEYDSKKARLQINVKNRFETGDTLELITPAGNKKFKLTHMEDEKGNTVSAAPGSGHVVYLPLEEAEYEFGLVTKELV